MGENTGKFETPIITRTELITLLTEGKADITVQQAAAHLLGRDRFVINDLKLRNSGLRFANGELKKLLQQRQTKPGTESVYVSMERNDG